MSESKQSQENSVLLSANLTFSLKLWSNEYFDEQRGAARTGSWMLLGNPVITEVWNRNGPPGAAENSVCHFKYQCLLFLIKPFLLR